MTQGGFRDGLRHRRDERKPCASSIEAHGAEDSSVRSGHAPCDPGCSRQDVIGHPRRLERGERRWVDTDRARARRPIRATVDDARVDAEAAELGAEGETGGTGADDQDVVVEWRHVNRPDASWRASRRCGAGAWTCQPAGSRIDSSRRV